MRIGLVRCRTPGCESLIEPGRGLCRICGGRKTADVVDSRGERRRKDDELPWLPRYRRTDARRRKR